MAQTENREKREANGCLVIANSEGAPQRILYADDIACVMTGLSLEELLKVEPAQAVRGLEVTARRLDSCHTLWMLAGDGAQEAGQPEQPQPERLAPEQLRQENARLEEALKAAQDANMAKSRFLSNMSHDIRTPMNAILGMTAIALSHIDEKARVQDSLQKIQTASNHLMSLVNDVLDMSRIDSGRMALNEEDFSLADLVHDITVIMRPQAVQKKQDLQMEIGLIHEENLVGDPLRLRQIWVNIIGNAVKYTQEGGEIRVQISQRQEKGAVWVDFVCRDNGIGMSKEFLTRIFVPFERVHNSQISRIEGTGLGMAIVKNLVDRMNGEIRVESAEGVGSTFYVNIPLSAASQTRRQIELPGGRPVLLAESLDGRAAQIEKYLRAGGLETVRMTTGLSAVTWLTEAQYENRMPCALVLGQELGDMPVLELASHARQLAGQAFPILLVSEEDWAQIEYRAVRAGVNDFVPCPLFESRLLETLSALTGAARADGDSGDGNADYGDLHVLLVEDNAINQEIAVELLSMIGVQVETADNGQQAVEAFCASEEGHFGLIFMDIQMPVMDGYEAARRIRRAERKDAASVSIVAMTANAFVEDVRLSKDAGMDGHLSKPVDVEHLQEALQDCLHRKGTNTGKSAG